MARIYTPFLFKHEYEWFLREWPRSNLPKTFSQWQLIHVAHCKKIRQQGNEYEPLPVSFEEFRTKMQALTIIDPGVEDLNSYAGEMGAAAHPVMKLL